LQPGHIDDRVDADGDAAGYVADEESLIATTLNGAYSLRLGSEIGSIEVGKRADLVLLDAPNYLHLVYHFGVNLVSHTMRDGEWVHA
jgi:imidazolonepropionase